MKTTVSKQKLPDGQVVMVTSRYDLLWSPNRYGLLWSKTRTNRMISKTANKSHKIFGKIITSKL